MSRWKHVALSAGLALAGLCAAVPGALAQDQKSSEPGFQERLEALVERMNAVEQAWRAKIDAAASDSERDRIYAQENPAPTFIEPFRELAFEAAGTESAAGAWTWVWRLALELGRPEEANEALEVLVHDHLSSPVLAEVADQLRYQRDGAARAGAVSALRTIREGSPLAPVKAAAQFSLSAQLLGSADETEKAEARELLLELRDRLAEAGPWKERAARVLFELERLQVGMIAPDFEAVDQDGVKWKLSDYRGKVVILDFWGIW